MSHQIKNLWNVWSTNLFNFRSLKINIVSGPLQSEYVPSFYCVSGSGLSILHTLFYLIFTTNLGRNYYYHVHFKDEKTGIKVFQCFAQHHTHRVTNQTQIKQISSLPESHRILSTTLNIQMIIEWMIQLWGSERVGTHRLLFACSCILKPKLSTSPQCFKVVHLMGNIAKVLSKETVFSLCYLGPGVGQRELLEKLPDLKYSEEKSIFSFGMKLVSKQEGTRSYTCKSLNFSFQTLLSWLIKKNER